MTGPEVALLLGALVRYPAQIMLAPDDTAVSLWQESLDDDMPMEWAIRWVAGYFSQPDRSPLGPGELNAAYRASVGPPKFERVEGTEPPSWWREARAQGRLPEVSE